MDIATNERENTDVENEEGVFRAEDLRRAVRWNPGGFLVPPLVTTRRPRDIVSGARKDKNVLHEGAFLESRVDDSLCGDGFAAAFTFVGRNDDTTFAVQHSIA